MRKYGYILLMYATRWQLWMIVGFMAVSTLPAFLGGTVGPFAHMRIEFFLFTTMTYFAVLVQQVKMQVATPAARLLPGYRLAHLLIAGILALPTLVGLPVLVSFSEQWSLLSTCGYFLPMAASIGWAVYLGRIGYWPPAMMLYAFPLFGKMPEWLVGVMTGSMPALMGVVTGASVLALVVLGWRMVGLTEEMPEYSRNAHVGRRNPFGGREPGQAVAWENGGGRFMRVSSRRLEWITRGANRGVVHRVLRWQTGSFGWKQGLLLSAFPILFMLVICAQSGISPHTMFSRVSSGKLGAKNFYSLFYIVAILIALRPMIRATLRWPMFGRELLMPVSRSAFFIENGLCMAADCGVMWISAAAGFVIIVGIIDPALLASGSLWLSLLSAGAVQGLMMAFGLWVLRYRTVGVMSITVTVLMCATMLAPLFAGIEFAESVPLVGWLAAVGVVIGLTVAVLYAAHRSWMGAELG